MIQSRNFLKEKRIAHYLTQGLTKQWDPYHWNGSGTNRIALGGKTSQGGSLSGVEVWTVSSKIARSIFHNGECQQAVLYSTMVDMNILF